MKYNILLSLLCVTLFINAEQPKIVEDFLFAAPLASTNVEVIEDKKEAASFFQNLLQKISPASISKFEKHVLLSDAELYQIFAALFSSKFSENDILPYDVAHDLELFCGLSSTGKEINLFQIFFGKKGIAPLKTISGQFAAIAQLAQPTDNSEKIVEWQNIIKLLMQHPEKLKVTEQLLLELQKHEHYLAEFFKEQKMVSEAEYNLIYSKKLLLEKLTNNFPAAWQAGTWIPAAGFTFAVPLTIVALAISWVRLVSNALGNLPALGIEANQSFFSALKTVCRGIINLYSGPHAAEALKWHAIIIGTPTILLGYRQYALLNAYATKAEAIQKYLIHVADYIKTVEQLYKTLASISELHENYLLRAFEQFHKNESLSSLNSLLSRNSFSGTSSRLSNWGNIFIAFRELEASKNHFLPIIHSIGQLDVATTCAKLMLDEIMIDQHTKFCFVSFIDNADHPGIEAKNFWNPFILSHKNRNEIITNSLSLDNDTQNVILTGPNTCGKTATTVGLMLNAILAQSFGIAAAESFLLTPISKFHLTLTIRTDGAVGDSRFKAEVREAQKLLESVKQLETENKFSLTVLDEIFTGTNPEDGSNAAFNFMKKLGALKNNNTLLATHYQNLTELGTPFTNYKIKAQIEVVDGIEIIKRFFTIEPGISTLNVANIILAQAGL